MSHASTDPGAEPGESEDLRHLAVRVALYLAALVPFYLVYATKERALILSPTIGFAAAVATWGFLRDLPVEPRRQVLNALGVGFIVGQLTWALGYWAVVPWIGAAALWMAFYVLSGLAEHGLAGTLDRRVTIEYGLVGLVGALIVLASTPWQE